MLLLVTQLVVIKINAYLFFIRRSESDMKQFASCHTSRLVSYPSYRQNSILFYLHACIDSHVFEAVAWTFDIVLSYWPLYQSVFQCYKSTWLKVKTEQQTYTDTFVHKTTLCLIGDSQCFEIVIFIALYVFKRTNSIQLWFIATKLFAEQNGLGKSKKQFYVNTHTVEIGCRDIKFQNRNFRITTKKGPEKWTLNGKMCRLVCLNSSNCMFFRFVLN